MPTWNGLLKRLLDDVRAGLVSVVVTRWTDAAAARLRHDHGGAGQARRHVRLGDAAVQYDGIAGAHLEHLLSFAQFEREMIAERTRDKMSAARRKRAAVAGARLRCASRWRGAGGNVKEVARAGYLCDVPGPARCLVVEELWRGWTLKRWTTRDGKTVGGKPFTCPSLHLLRPTSFTQVKCAIAGRFSPVNMKPSLIAVTWDKVHDRSSPTHLAAAVITNKHGALLRDRRCATCNVGMVHTYTRRARASTVTTFASRLTSAAHSAQHVGVGSRN